MPTFAPGSILIQRPPKDKPQTLAHCHIMIITATASPHSAFSVLHMVRNNHDPDFKGSHKHPIEIVVTNANTNSATPPLFASFCPADPELGQEIVKVAELWRLYGIKFTELSDHDSLTPERLSQLHTQYMINSPWLPTIGATGTNCISFVFDCVNTALRTCFPQQLFSPEHYLSTAIQNTTPYDSLYKMLNEHPHFKHEFNGKIRVAPEMIPSQKEEYRLIGRPSDLAKQKSLRQIPSTGNGCAAAHLLLLLMQQASQNQPALNYQVMCRLLLPARLLLLQQQKRPPMLTTDKQRAHFHAGLQTFFDSAQTLTSKASAAGSTPQTEHEGRSYYPSAFNP